MPLIVTERLFDMLSVEDFANKQILFLQTREGQKLSFLNDNVVIRDADNKIICQVTCYKLFALIIIGNITITSGLIQRAKKFGFAIVLMTTSFRPYQTISAFADGNTILRKNQYAYSDLTVAKEITKNKIANQRFMLMAIRDKSDDLKKAVACIDKYMLSIDECDSVQSIMGVEGCASKIYFKNYFDNVIWKGRKPRIKFDMTNALLDIGYTILFSYIDSLLSLFGFDRYVGVLHQQFYMRKSLVCDIVEPFRVIIDKAVKKGINLGQFKERDFDIYNGKWCLKYKKSSDYSKVFITEILNYKEEIYIYVRSVYRCFMRQQYNSFPQWRPDNGTC